jgi:hypothetical protein
MAASGQHQPAIESLRMATLPPALLAELYQALSHSDMTWINRIIALIQPYDSTLADALTRLTQDFRYDHILALLQAIGIKGDV